MSEEKPNNMEPIFVDNVKPILIDNGQGVEFPVTANFFTKRLIEDLDIDPNPKFRATNETQKFLAEQGELKLITHRGKFNLWKRAAEKEKD